MPVQWSLAGNVLTNKSNFKPREVGIHPQRSNMINFNTLGSTIKKIINIIIKIMFISTNLHKDFESPNIVYNLCLYNLLNILCIAGHRFSVIKYLLYSLF